MRQVTLKPTAVLPENFKHTKGTHVRNHDNGWTVTGVIENGKVALWHAVSMTHGQTSSDMYETDGALDAFLADMKEYVDTVEVIGEQE